MTAAGTQPIAAPRPAARPVWSSDAPRARRSASSVARRSTIIRAASSSTMAAVTARLTYSSHSSASTAAAVPMNAAAVSRNAPSVCCRPVLAVIAVAPAASGPVSARIFADDSLQRRGQRLRLVSPAAR